MLNYYRSPAKAGELALVEVVVGGRQDRVILPHGDHPYEDGVRAKRLIHVFPASDPFLLVIPKEEVAKATTKLGTSLGVYYTWKATAGANHWQQTQTFWKRRKVDFIVSFLQHLKSGDTGGTSKFNLVEDGRLVRYANEARRLAAKASAEASFFNIQVFGVHLGEDKEMSPFDYE